MARILPLGEADDRDAVRAEIEAIFFESAATQHFASEEGRAAYCELWLGRYLRECPEECFVALDDHGAIAGYLAGTLFSDRVPLSGPDYYVLFPAALIDACPAHIHVNVRADCRGREIGSELIAAFRAHCRKSGISGFHAITAADSRAARFFMRCGLGEQARLDWRARKIVFLGETLD